MEIKTYNAAQLQEFILSDEFRAMPVIPISTPRAVSHIHNPRAEANDALLIIAREAGKMTGYLGVLPDKIFNEQGEACKCGWLSCMWVDPEVRGKGIAKKLIGTAFDSYNDHILVTEFTPEAKGLYDRSGHFRDLRTSDGLRCYLRFNLHEVLPKKSARYKTLTPILALADAIANVPVGLRLRLTSAPGPGVVFEPVDMIDADIMALISTKSVNNLERRGIAELSWIRQYPWLSTTAAPTESSRYHFSVGADRFENLFFKITDKGQLKGFLHLTIRDNHLKVPYAYLSEDLIGDAVSHITDLMIRYRLNMLTVFHPFLVKHLRHNKDVFIYRRPIHRRYIITKTLDAHISDHAMLQIQDGDADCAFT